MTRSPHTFSSNTKATIRTSPGSCQCPRRPWSRSAWGRRCSPSSRSRPSRCSSIRTTASGAPEASAILLGSGCGAFLRGGNFGEPSLTRELRAGSGGRRLEERAGRSLRSGDLVGGERRGSEQLAARERLSRGGRVRSDRPGLPRSGHEAVGAQALADGGLDGDRADQDDLSRLARLCGDPDEADRDRGGAEPRGGDLGVRREPGSADQLRDGGGDERALVRGVGLSGGAGGRRSTSSQAGAPS